MKKLCCVLFIACCALALFCDESWIIPLDSLIYRRAEELFLCEGKVPLFEETPVIAEELKNQLAQLSENARDTEIVEQINELNAEVNLLFPLLSPLVELGFSAGLDSESGRQHMIPTYDYHGVSTGPDKDILDFTYMYEINELPSVIKAGFIAQAGGFSLLFLPEIRETTTALLEDENITNIPGDLTSINFYSLPFRGISTYYNAPIELRLGRDKLHVGPSTWGGLTLNKHVPYYDYIKARFFIPGFSLSSYVINLNPIMTRNESDYLNTLDSAEYKKLEPNGTKNGDPYMDRFKNLVLSKATFIPWDWLLFSITQCNLVGGRPLEISDFNPLLVFHNNFDEGTYSVPLSVTATVVPYKGIKIYGEWYFYDAPAGDETDPDENAFAMGYQLGFTLLSNPFFQLGPGRFRLDAEITYVDPWTYGKAYDLRKFTSRFVYVESFIGRRWVDYPLGFYLGPDVIDIHCSVSYGIPGEWEAELHWNTTAKGQVDLYGWGEDNDYYHIGETGYPLSWAPTGTVEWTHAITLSGYWVITKGVTVKAWYRLQHIKNRYNTADAGEFYHWAGASAVWKLF
ncbi:MAG: hypothetical protein JW822_01745 [Spirochaetales bacterium]|nr:hypothetical protein [Spirochaetales bacterium]